MIALHLEMIKADNFQNLVQVEIAGAKFRFFTIVNLARGNLEWFQLKKQLKRTIQQMGGDWVIVTFHRNYWIQCTVS